MRIILWPLLAALVLTQARAQSNAPVKLALIAESQDASTASDLLTVELSKNPQITLLERNEIEKVYREQGFSAENRNYLKLGQVLGADGLVLIDAAVATNRPSAPKLLSRNSSTGPDLHIQIIAVKPGVLLENQRFPVPPNLSQWAAEVATHLQPLLPKLSVLLQDAVPISIVNLRAAMQSPEMEEQERELTTLAIERLSREPQLFVLERRNLQLLSQEKQLNAVDDSAFWNGAYLLEGTMDRNGYSTERMTVSARLVPPKGGTPVSIEVSGSRTDLAGIVNQLADQVHRALKLSAATKPWNAADEAQQYFNEAKWALRWSLYDEAQTAAEAAWALGKQDLDCALFRIRAVERRIPGVLPPRYGFFGGREAPPVNSDSVPDLRNMARARLALQLYEDFSRRMPAGEPTNRSPYYLLGLDVLGKATGILRQYQYQPKRQSEVSDQLSELRASCRRVADWICRSPSVHESYWVNELFPSRDDIYQNFGDPDEGLLSVPRNFFQFELRRGYLFQETPEDCLAMYRGLMSNPLFVCMHSEFWFRANDNPRLAAWRAADRKRLPETWRQFLAELKASTNSLWAMEARAVEFTDARMAREEASGGWDNLHLTGTNDTQRWQQVEAICVERDHAYEAAGKNFSDFILANYSGIVSNRDALLDLDWGLERLYGGSGVVTAVKEKLENDYRHEFLPELAKRRDAYLAQNADRLTEMKNQKEFEQQKKYLAELTPYDFFQFNKVFSEKKYSKSQAAELKPLVEAYQSNLMAQASAASTNRMQKMKAESAARMIGMVLGKPIDEMLNPKPTATASLARPSAGLAAQPAAALANAAPAVVPLTNVLLAKTFLAIPKEQKMSAENPPTVIIFGHRMVADKLLLDLRYADGRPEYASTIFGEGAALLNRDNQWKLTLFPRQKKSYETSADFYEGNFGFTAAGGSRFYLELFENAYYASDRDAIRRYDLKTEQWRELPFSGQVRAQLYAVNGHLYAASSEGIWEIFDNGQSARILASTRRRPAASILDSRDSLGNPVLFSGENNSLRVALGGEIFMWEGSDWKPILTVQNASEQEVYQDTVFFRKEVFRQPQELWRLSLADTEPALCLREPQIIFGARYNNDFTPPVSRSKHHSVRPLWKSPKDRDCTRTPLTTDGTNIYLIAMPVDTNRTWTSDTMRQGRRIEPDLWCLAPGSREPLRIPIRLDPNSGPTSIPGGPQGNRIIWAECSSQYLFIGAPNLAGVWAVPTTEIRAEIERQLRAQPPIPKEVTPEERQKSLLAKYDLNRNGQFDPEEKEAAISDPAFLEFEMGRIDTNANWRIDAEELVYFDANTNRMLEASELAGIQAAQRVLAAKALKEFDSDESGELEPQEYGEFTGGRTFGVGFRAMPAPPASSEVERLEHFLEGVTEGSIQQTLMRRGGPVWRPGQPRFGQSQFDPSMLKEEIERYWLVQYGKVISNAQPGEPRNSSKKLTP